MFFKKHEKTEPQQLPWKSLEAMDSLDSLTMASEEKPQLIFKHSTRCIISKMALRSFENEWEEYGGIDADIHFLDLIAFRDVSNEIASRFSVVHESPQVILLSGGKAIYDDSHQSISLGEVRKRI